MLLACQALFVPPLALERSYCCRNCFGGSDTTSDQLSPERQASRANLAAQQELNSLADARDMEAEQQYEDSADKADADLQRHPFRRRFRFTHMSEHLPSITSHLHRFSRSSKEQRRSTDGTAQDIDKIGGQGSLWPSQSDSSSQLSEPIKLEGLSKETLGSMPSGAKLSSSPILSVRTGALVASSANLPASAAQAQA